MHLNEIRSCKASKVGDAGSEFVPRSSDLNEAHEWVKRSGRDVYVSDQFNKSSRARRSCLFPWPGFDFVLSDDGGGGETVLTRAAAKQVCCKGAIDH